MQHFGVSQVCCSGTEKEGSTDGRFIWQILRIQTSSHPFNSSSVLTSSIGFRIFSCQGSQTHQTTHLHFLTALKSRIHHMLGSDQWASSASCFGSPSLPPHPHVERSSLNDWNISNACPQTKEKKTQSGGVERKEGALTPGWPERNLILVYVDLTQQPSQVLDGRVGGPSGFSSHLETLRDLRLTLELCSDFTWPRDRCEEVTVDSCQLCCNAAKTNVLF